MVWWWWMTFVMSHVSGVIAISSHRDIRWHPYNIADAWHPVGHPPPPTNCMNCCRKRHILLLLQGLRIRMIQMWVKCIWRKDDTIVFYKQCIRHFCLFQLSCQVSSQHQGTQGEGPETSIHKSKNDYFVGVRLVRTTIFHFLFWDGLSTNKISYPRFGTLLQKWCCLLRDWVWVRILGGNGKWQGTRGHYPAYVHVFHGVLKQNELDDGDWKCEDVTVINHSKWQNTLQPIFTDIGNISVVGHGSHAHNRICHGSDAPLQGSSNLVIYWWEWSSDLFSVRVRVSQHIVIHGWTPVS